MRILYDGQIFSSQEVGGINRYFINLIKQLPLNAFPLLTTSNNKPDDLPTHPNLELFYFPSNKLRPERIFSLPRKLYFRSILRSKSYDLVHPTYYSLTTDQGMQQLSRPVVLSVWDMIHELFPEEMDRDGFHAAMKHKAILQADAIICISENTRFDLLERYPILDDRVFVTYLASDLNASIADPTASIPDFPYFIYVGGRSRYKNFSGLLLAFAKVVSVSPDIRLCVVGSSFNNTEKKHIYELGIEPYVYHYGVVSDRHLAKLYQCSLALVYPSYYEGFGIPPLEAMSCGTIPIVSNSSSLPEVVGNAGLKFNPHQPDELTDQLLFVLNNSAERERLIALGYKQSKKFAWDKTANQTMKIYKLFA